MYYSNTEELENRYAQNLRNSSHLLKVSLLLIVASIAIVLYQMSIKNLKLVGLTCTHVILSIMILMKDYEWNARVENLKIVIGDVIGNIITI